MPFPINQEAMFTAGYSYARWERCPVCTLDVEVWNSPGKREIAMDPMPGISSPAVRHWDRCNIAPKQPVEPQTIKMYGVTDKNMIAAGWLGGTLAIQFRYGKYHYANVAEDVFQKIRNNPFPNSLFVKLVKNHPDLYPCTKVG
jgi:hypothetical protein